MLKQGSMLPLFPLDLVLFPGMMLPLHIFEERYKIMIKDCISTGQPFGVVLSKHKQVQLTGAENSFFDEMYHIGTTAQITAVEHLKDGRMNLITVGQDRFMIQDIELSPNEFFVGHVNPFPIQDDNPEKVSDLLKRLRPLVKQYINHLAEASGEDLSEAILPADPTALAYLAGTAMQGPWLDKQKLLSAKSLTTLMTNALNVLEREDKILVYMLKAYAAHQRVERLPFVDYSLN